MRRIKKKRQSVVFDTASIEEYTNYKWIVGESEKDKRRRENVRKKEITKKRILQGRWK